MRKRLLLLVGAVLLICIITLGLCSVAFAGDGAYRTILKAGSLLAAILGIVGIAVAGYLAGKDYDSYTGWERYTHGAGMFYNRKPFRMDNPTYEADGPTRRVNIEEGFIGRMGAMMQLMHPPDGGESKWLPSMGIEALPEPYRDFFMEHPDNYKWMLGNMDLTMKQAGNWAKFSTQFAIADAWSASMASSFEDSDGTPQPDRLYPPEPKGPPEEWDFRGIRRKKPLLFKSPKHASELIKKISHTFGATRDTCEGLERDNMMCLPTGNMPLLWLRPMNGTRCMLTRSTALHMTVTLGNA